MNLIKITCTNAGGLVRGVVEMECKVDRVDVIGEKAKTFE